MVLSSAALRPARPASSISAPSSTSSTSIRSSGIGGSVSPSGENKRAARSKRAPIASATPKPWTSSSSSSKRGGKGKEQQNVDYGRDWYAATRDPSRGLTPRQEMQLRREANRAANNGLERKDLYTDAWAGSEFRGSNNNVLTWLIVASVATPVLGLLFAWQTYGTLWG